VIATELRPPCAPLSTDSRTWTATGRIDPYKAPLLVVSGCMRSCPGASAAGDGATWLLWRNGQNFGVRTLSSTRTSRSTRSATRVALPRWALLRHCAGLVAAALVTHYLYGGLKRRRRGERPRRPRRPTLGAARAVVLLRPVAYWMDRYGLAVHGGGFFRGQRLDRTCVSRRQRVTAGQGDPAAIAVICAVLFFATCGGDLVAAGHRVRSAGALRVADRGGLPGDRAAFQVSLGVKREAAFTGATSPATQGRLRVGPGRRWTPTTRRRRCSRGSYVRTRTPRQHPVAGPDDRLPTFDRNSRSAASTASRRRCARPVQHRRP